MKTKISILIFRMNLTIAMLLSLQINSLFSQPVDSTHVRQGVWGDPTQKYEFRNVPENVGYLTSFPIEKIRGKIGEENFNKLNLDYWVHTSVNNAELAIVERLTMSQLGYRNMIDYPSEGGLIGDNCWEVFEKMGYALFVRNNIVVLISPYNNSDFDPVNIEQSARIIDSVLVQSEKVVNSLEIPAPVLSSFEIISELPKNFDDNVRAKIEATDPNNQKLYFRKYAVGYAGVWENGDTVIIPLSKNTDVIEDSTKAKVMIWVWNEDHYITLVTHEIPF